MKESSKMFRHVILLECTLPSTALTAVWSRIQISTCKGGNNSSSKGTTFKLSSEDSALREQTEFLCLY